MNKHQLTLSVLPDQFAVCKLSSNASLPQWAMAGAFDSITRTGDELSVVCPQSMVPEGIQAEQGWRCLRVVGTMPFTAVGILAALVNPLADASISVFAISTFDTDYLLIQECDLENAVMALRQYGHSVS